MWWFIVAHRLLHAKYRKYLKNCYPNNKISFCRLCGRIFFLIFVLLCVSFISPFLLKIEFFLVLFVIFHNEYHFPMKTSWCCQLKISHFNTVTVNVRARNFFISFSGPYCKIPTYQMVSCFLGRYGTKAYWQSFFSDYPVFIYIFTCILIYKHRTWLYTFCYIYTFYKVN